MPVPRQIQFITFYSFQGGVGRSLALLNCAQLLSGLGRYVLMLDLDFRKPALTLLAAGRQAAADRLVRSSAPQRRPGRGLIEYLTTQAIPRGKRADQRRRPTAPVPITWSANGTADAAGSPGSVALMPAGAVDQKYEQRLAALHAALGPDPARHKLQAALRGLRSDLAEAGAFDFVLVDVPAGFSEVAYAAGAELADQLIILSALNPTCVAGTARFLNVLKPLDVSRHWSARLTLVTSPDPPWQDRTMAAQHRALLREVRVHAGIRASAPFSLPYEPAMALGGAKIATGRPSGALATAYVQLLAHIRLQAHDTSAAWSQRARAAIPHPASHPPRAVADLPILAHALRRLRPLDQPAYRQILGEALTALDRHPDLGHAGIALCDELLALDPRQPLIALHKARVVGRADPRQGLALLADAERMARALDDRPARLSILMERAVLAGLAGDSSLALRAYRKVHRLARGHDPAVTAQALRALAASARGSGKPRQATRLLREAARLDRDAANLDGMVADCAGLANIAITAGDRGEARRHLEICLAWARERADEQKVAFCLRWLGTLHRGATAYAEARHHYSQALAIHRRGGNRMGIALLVRSLAHVDRLEGDFASARKGYAESLATGRSIGSLEAASGIAIAIECLARLDSYHGDYRKARRGLAQSIKVAQRSAMGRLGMPWTFLVLGDLELASGDPIAARKQYEKARIGLREQMDLHGMAMTAHKFAEADQADRKLARARQGFSEALGLWRKAGDRRGQCSSTVHLAGVEALLHPTRSTRPLKQALHRARALGDVVLVIRGLLLLSEVAAARKLWREAIDAAQHAVVESDARQLRGWAAVARAHLATASARAGDGAAARKHACKALDFFREQAARHPLVKQLEALLSPGLPSPA